MKKILLFVLAISMVVSFALPFASFAADGAVEIDSAADLAAIKDNLAGNYVLTADIEGAAQIPGEFTGTLDGNGFKVSGLTEALFEAVSGTVKNITVQATIDVKTTADEADTAVAVVVETAKGGAELINVTAEGSVKADYTATGGKVYTGGIAGTTYATYGQRITFTRCTNNAAIEVTGNNKIYGVAGIIGASEQTSAKNVGTIYMNQCINNAAIKGIKTKGSVAGLVGRFAEIAKAQDAEGNVIYEELAGGVPTGNVTNDKASGRQIANTAYVVECANKGDVTVKEGTGEGSAGLFGYFRQGLISKCYNTGNITSNKGADGFISWCNLETSDDGSQTRWISIVDCYNAGKVDKASLANVQNVDDALSKFADKTIVTGNCYLKGTTPWRTTDGGRPTFNLTEGEMTTAVECENAAAMLEVLSAKGYVADPYGEGYPVLAFEVADLLTTDKDVYIEGEPIMVTPVGSGEDRVGIWKEGDKNARAWQYIDSANGGKGSGVALDIVKDRNENKVPDLSAGEYIVGIIPNGQNLQGSTPVATKVITILPSTWEQSFSSKLDIVAFDGETVLVSAEYDNTTGTLTVDGQTYKLRGTLADNNIVIIDADNNVAGTVTKNGNDVMISLGKLQGYLKEHVEGPEPDNGLVVGENAVKVPGRGNCAAVTFKAPVDGKYILKAAAGETNAYVALTNEFGIEVIELPYKMNLKKGQIVSFEIGSSDFTADEINLVIETDAEIPETGDIAMFIALAGILSLGVAAVALKRRQSVR